MTIIHAPSATSLDRNLGVDLLRIFSLVLVILYHYDVEHFMLTGLHGVVIFFMISGYCMTFSTSGRSGAEFLKARFWRLIPTFAICATLTALVECFLPDVMPDRTQPLLSYPLNLFCLSHGMFACDAFGDLLLGRALPFPWIDGAYWSLLVEIRFYLLLWLFQYGLKLKQPLIFIAALGLLAPLNLSTEYVSKSQDFFLYLSFFAFGMSLSASMRKIKIGYVGLVFSFLIFTVASLMGSRAISMNLSPNTYASFALCFAIFACTIFIFRKQSNRYVSYFGLLTYPIYLLHQDIGYISIKIFNMLNPEAALAITCFIILMAAIAVQFIVSKTTPRVRTRVENYFSRRFRTFLAFR